MTADDDTHSESDNSTSRSTTDAPTRRLTQPIATAVTHADWLTRDQLAIELGLTTHDVTRALDVLDNTTSIDVFTLGDTRLAVAADYDEREAIAALSDERERHWRTECGHPPADHRTEDQG